MSTRGSEPEPEQGSVSPQDAFYRGLATEVMDAYKNRSKERYLYAPINRILVKHAESITPPSPSVDLSVHSQYYFESGNDTETAQNKFTVNNVDFEAPTEIPDFVRVFVENEKEDADHILVDFVEVKPLDTKAGWHTPEAQKAAANAVKDSLFQLYRQAMTGFFHHPEWTCVYGILVVGVYFSLFKWMRHDGKESEVCPPIEYDFNSFPAQPISPEEHQARIDVLEAAIKECSNRRMPEVLCWNLPVFQFHGKGKHPKIWFSELTLTEEFLWALKQPFEEHAKTKYGLSFLSAPEKKPRSIEDNIRETEPAGQVYDILCTTPLQQLKECRPIIAEESASTASLKQNEKRSFGTDKSYGIRRKLRKTTAANSSPRVLRPRRNKQTANGAAASNHPVAAPAQSASARVGGPPNI